MNPVKPSDTNSEVTPMTGRPRFGSMPRQVLPLAGTAHAD